MIASVSMMHFIIEYLECKSGARSRNNKSLENDHAMHKPMNISNERDGEEGNVERMSLYDYYCFIYGALLKQGSNLEPDSDTQ